MRRTFMLSLSAMCILALTLAAGNAESPVEQNKAIVRKFFAVVFNEGKLDQADQFIAADALDHEVMPGQKEPVPALANLKELLTDLRKGFPDMKVKIDDVIAEGDRVVVRARMIGTNKGDFHGMPPTGNTVFVDFIDIVRLENGKVVEHWGLFNEKLMEHQLAAVPAAPPAPANGNGPAQGAVGHNP